VKRRTIRIFVSTIILLWFVGIVFAPDSMLRNFAIGYLQVWLIGSFILQYLDAKE
jgi:hypothetical protein